MEKDTSLLIVDDDVETCSLLSQYLSKHNFTVSTVNDGMMMDQYLHTTTTDLIILDLMLPGENGLSILKRLNSETQIPVIMLSANGEDIDRIIGLEIGADDYLAKPFNPRELLARIRSVLRRKRVNTSHKAKIKSHLYTFGPYQFDTSALVLLLNGEKLTLTSGELTLLKIFVENPLKVLSRDMLLDKLKGYGCAPFDRSVDVRIMRLRQKIEQGTASPLYIQTVWGKGYKFVPDQHIP